MSSVDMWNAEFTYMSSVDMWNVEHGNVRLLFRGIQSLLSQTFGLILCGELGS